VSLSPYVDISQCLCVCLSQCVCVCVYMCVCVYIYVCVCVCVWLTVCLSLLSLSLICLSICLFFLSLFFFLSILGGNKSDVLQEPAQTEFLIALLLNILSPYVKVN